MEDQFLKELYRDPDPGFERRLGERLKAQTPAPAPSGWAAVPWRTAGALGCAGLIAALVFTVPSVGVWAQSFLDIFRVRTFTAVPVDPARIDRLESETVDLQRMVADRVQVLKERGEPVTVATAEDAGRAAGFSVRAPGHQAGLAPEGIAVVGEGVIQMTADVSVLEEVLRLMDIRDAKIPANLDGSTIRVRMPPSVQMRFRNEGRRVRFVQSQSPEVRLPPAMELEDLGVLALRIAGLPRSDAERLARSIDWHTTLLVPVPTSARSFRKVHVHGREGLLIEATKETDAIPAGRHGGAVVMWAEDGMVFAMGGNVGEADLLEMAESVR